MQPREDLIIEIGTEELPPMHIRKILDHFSGQFLTQLAKKKLTYAKLEKFSTCRRIAILFHKLELQAPAPQELVPAATIVEIFNKAVQVWPNPKMAWGEGEYTFIRPVHWVLAMLGTKVLELEFCGIKAQNFTRGHRFLAPGKIQLEHPTQYPDKLAKLGVVIADPALRKQQIFLGLQAEAKKLAATWLEDQALLEQVTNMVEAPEVLCAQFSKEFLELPDPCLISVMKNHQKSFALVDQHGKLLPKFLLVTNMPKIDHTKMLAGYEKVMHARLQDAMFLYKQDLNTPLQALLLNLKNIVFAENLGELDLQTKKIQLLAKKIAALLTLTPKEQEIIEQAALFCKVDLGSKMVQEFPELQGIMGGHYVQRQLAQPAIATAIMEHYLPRFAEDHLPITLPGICISLADRLNTLVGMFILGKIATGDQDPFSLRRHALAMIRILVEKDLALSLPLLFKITIATYAELQATILGSMVIPEEVLLENLLTFCQERAKNWYISTYNIPANYFNALFAVTGWDLQDLSARLGALVACKAQEELEQLLSIYKRITKIFGNTPQQHFEHYVVNPELWQSEPEQALGMAVKALAQDLPSLIGSKKYQELLEKFIALKPTIELFFAHVMVMAKEPAIRLNRQNLLQQLISLFAQFVDFAKLCS